MHLNQLARLEEREKRRIIEVDPQTIILPLKLKRNPGRPRKERIREPDEVGPSAERKRSYTIRCKNCLQLGHNKRSCQRAPVSARVKGM